MHVQINPITRCRYDGLYHNVESRSILVYTSLVVEQAGLPAVSTQQPPLRVDDSTQVPVHKPAGTPLTRPVSRTVPVMVPDPDSTVTPAPLVPHPTQTETVTEQVPVTISEYDMLVWLCFDRRNPAPVAIETILEGGMKRRLGLPSPAYVFVQTPAWEAAFS